MKRDTMILLVMPEYQRQPLLSKLQRCRAEVLAVSDCREAHQVLRSGLPVRVVVTATALADGDWALVLEDLKKCGAPAQLLVCSHLPEMKLWCDVLERGAFDVIIDSYSQKELDRIVENAASKVQAKKDVLERLQPVA